jgi:N-acetylmuramoyl-L-alanine amidase
MVVLHYTAMESAEAALQRLCDPKIEVSCHYLIARHGAVFQLVDETQRAWHAGAGCWGNVNDVNSHSIGIELCNLGPLANLPPFPAAQMNALVELLADIRTRNTIHAARVIGHSDMAPSRKADPGPAFDWQRLALESQSVWVPSAPGSGADPQDGLPSWPRFLRAARLFGYCAEVAKTDLLQAFRLRFAPTRLGQPLQQADIAQIEALSTIYPCIDGASNSA